MGRGRGKGKKSTIVAGHEELGSGGEESLPAYKRRGRPQKPLKEDTDEEDTEKILKDEEGDDMKPTISSTQKKGSILENGRKRKRFSQVKENNNLNLEENGIKSNMEESNMSSGFRQNGSRRKSKPRRAAVAGAEYT